MILKDYYKGNYCNSSDDYAIAIEPEISYQFFDKKINNYYNNYKYEWCSSDIIELLRVHNQSEELRMKIYNDVKEFYKNKFPIWTDWYVSWWVHFILFWEFWWFENQYQEIKELLLNCPLFCKIENERFYSRYNRMFKFNGDREGIIYWSKSHYIDLKKSLFSHWEIGVKWTPVEFRCNNVFDDRLQGYYQWVLLACKKGVEFDLIDTKLYEYVKKGEQKKRNSWWDVELKEMEGGSFEKSLPIIKKNIKKILVLLKEEELHKSAEMLKEYCNEYGIKYI